MLPERERSRGKKIFTYLVVGRDEKRAVGTQKARRRLKKGSATEMGFPFPVDLSLLPPITAGNEPWKA